jgi:hypothetical protein
MRSAALSLALLVALTPPALAGDCASFVSPAGTTITLGAPGAGQATISRGGSDVVCDLQANHEAGATRWTAMFFCGEVSQAATIVATSAADPTPAKILYRGAELEPACAADD